MAFIIPKNIEDLPLATSPVLVGNFVVEENKIAKRIPSETLNKILNTGISGVLKTSTIVPTTGYYKYDVFDAGTYTNVTPSITVTQSDLAANYVYVLVENNVAYKAMSAKPTTTTDQSFNATSPNAIANQRVTPLAKVLNYFIAPKAIRDIPMQALTNGLVRNGTGAILTDPGYWYQKVTIQAGDSGLYFKGVRPVTTAGSGYQQLYPTILTEDASGVFTGILDSARNDLPNPFLPFEGSVFYPAGAVNVWIVWQSGFGLPVVRALGDYRAVDVDAVKTYIDNQLSSATPAPNNVVVPLSKYSGATDPTLQNGYIDKDGIFINNPIDRCGYVNIPPGAQFITAINFDCPSYLQFADNAPNRIIGAASTVLPIKVPVNATRIYFNVLTKNTNLLNTATNSITFNTNSIYASVTTETLQSKILETADNGRIMMGEKIYSIAGIEKRLYTESLFSGFDPRTNYNIEPFGDGVMGSFGDKGRFIILNNQGAFTMRAFDLNRNLVATKNTVIYSKAMPTTINKLPPSGTMQVLFIGDSLWHNNSNKIGEEWARMLNSNAAETVIDNVIYKQGFGMGAGRVELVGKQGLSNFAYTIGNSLEILMETTVPYNNGTSGNPFFNPASGQPNELDDDGFNKQMDIKWFIEGVCGIGKYPKYIYLACGVNDIWLGGWRKDSLLFIKERLKRVLYRIKKACDTIAGGSSDVKILLVNHQFYPLNNGHTFEDTFSNSRQRKLWAEHYNNYEQAIKNESYKGVALSSFVRFVDCASSFDIDNGYNYLQVQRNGRSTVMENTIYDTVHVGTEGALMYADALLDDFLYNECQ